MRSLVLTLGSLVLVAGCPGPSTPEDTGRDVPGLDAAPPGDVPGSDVPPDVPGLDAPCVPSCAGRECGGDGCGGSCGTCSVDGEACTAAGTCECEPACSGRACGLDPRCNTSCGTCSIGSSCVGGSCIADCVPNCAGRTCGPDGCGGTCAPGCSSGRSCSAAGACVTTCVPNCDGTSCGSDGCGGRCTCTASSTCTGSPDFNCMCDPGFEVNPSFTGCIPVGGSCATHGVTANGYCVGADRWIFCDPVFGIQSLSCSEFGFGPCNDFGGGVGACTCTSSLMDQCGSVGTGSWNILAACNEFTVPGSVFTVNCGYMNPSPTAHCATYATSFGTRRSCMCANCQPFYSYSHTCESFPACSGTGCAVVPGTTTVPPLESCL
jgi:hypothetical protein